MVFRGALASVLMQFAAEGLRGSIIFSLTFLWTVDASAGFLSTVWADRTLVCGFLLTFSCKVFHCIFPLSFLWPLVYNVIISNKINSNEVCNMNSMPHYILKELQEFCITNIHNLYWHLEATFSLCWCFFIGIATTY